MEVVLDQVCNRLSATFGSIFTARYHHTCTVLTHILFWMCASQGQQLKYRTDGSYLLFYLWCGVFLLGWYFVVFVIVVVLVQFFILFCFSSPLMFGSLLSFRLYLLYVHNSLFLGSLRWHLESAEQFSPSGDGSSSLTLGTLVPRERGSPLGINPVVASDTVSLGHTTGLHSQSSAEAPFGFWDEKEPCQNNTQQALPIQQSITHCLLVCMCVHLIYRKAQFI